MKSWESNLGSGKICKKKDVCNCVLGNFTYCAYFLLFDKCRQSILIGYTEFVDDDVRRLVEEVGNQFRGDKYHLMNNNCNHFSSALTQILCGQEIPSWVNRLAQFSSCVPFLQRW